MRTSRRIFAIAALLGLVRVASAETSKHGAAISTRAAVPLDQVLAAPDKFKDKQVVVDGKVRQVCTRKGCWMELAMATDPAAPGCRVTFKDYAFFVPTSSKGSTARVEGTVAVKVLTKDEADHYASEGATLNREKDGSAREVRIIASGVELKR
jgi:hypothetical protein